MSAPSGVDHFAPFCSVVGGCRGAAGGGGEGGKYFYILFFSKIAEYLAFSVNYMVSVRHFFCIDDSRSRRWLKNQIVETDFRRGSSIPKRTRRYDYCLPTHDWQDSTRSVNLLHQSPIRLKYTRTQPEARVQGLKV